MSTAESELKEVKCIIRGLLISSPLACTIRQLESDYSKEVGNGIPYRKLGYPSTEAFLRSIPDTVCLTEPRHGCPTGMIIVQPVQSNKSEHVEKLVVRQKKAPNAMRGMKRASAVSTYLSQKRASSHSNTSGLAPSFVPMSLRVSLNRVCQRYAQHGLPLSSLANELSTDLYMAGWIHDGKSGWLSTFGFANMEDVIEAFIDNGLIKTTLKDGVKWIAPSAQKTVEEKRVPARQKELTDDDFHEDASLAVSMVSDKMKSNFRAIMRKHPNGLWCSLLPQEYRGLTGYSLEVKELGFVSIIQMAINLKDVFICSRPNSNSDWMLFDAQSNSVWNSPAAVSYKEVKMACLPLKILHNVEALLQEHSRGIMKHKFLSAYKDKYNEELPMADYGFDNLMSILAHLASRNVIHLKFCGNTPMICSPFCDIEVDSLKELRQNNDFIKALYPRGVMLPSDDIPVQSFPEDISAGCSIDMLITEVISPSFFWYQRWGSDVQAEFNQMMDDIQLFYNPGGPAEHRMPDATIQIGQLCVARFPPDPSECGEWHRTRITALPSLTEVEVFYVDYGSKCRALRSEIRFLDVKYGKLPIQAYKASLVNVRPPGYGLWLKHCASASTEDLIKRKPMWSAQANNSFLKLVENRPLVGVIANVYQDMISVALIDTSKENDVHINDFLVNANLAEFGKMMEEDDLLCNDLIRQSCSQASNPLKEKRLDEKSPGLRPPSVERNITPGINKQVSLQFDEESPVRTSSPFMSVQNSAEKNELLDLNKFHSGCDTELPSCTTRISVQHPVERGRFGPDADVIHLGVAAELPKSSATSPSLVQHTAERDRFGPDADVIHLGVAAELPKSSATSPSLVQHTAERGRFGPDADVIHLGVAAELPKSNTSSPSPVQHPVERGRFGPDADVVHLGVAAELPKSNATSPVPQQSTLKEKVLTYQQEGVPKKSEGFTYFENTMMNEAHMQLELEKVKLYQQQLQYQQLQTQLLLLAAQNSFMVGLPTVSNPLLSGQVIRPPPGLSNLNPLINAQPSVTDLLSSTLMNANPFAGLQSPFIPNALCGHFPMGSVGNLQFSGNIPLEKTNLMNSAESSPSVSLPPGFGQKAAETASPVKEWPVSPILPVPSNHEPNFSSKVSDRSAPVKKLVESEFISNKSNEIGANNLSIDNSQISGSAANLNKKCDPSLLLPAEMLYKNNDTSFVENKICFERKMDNCETLHASFEACSINGDNDSSATDDCRKKNDYQPKCKSRDEDKWKVNIEVDEEDEKSILKGNVNGKPVHVIKMTYYYYVLTEEILALFYNSLPVHVALKIVNLKPNGKKIESIVINSRKDREMYKRIQSLVGNEMVTFGSDIHLTSVDSLYYLCSSLGITD